MVIRNQNHLNHHLQMPYSYIFHKKSKENDK
jgi:hypothetical protein